MARATLAMALLALVASRATAPDPVRRGIVAGYDPNMIVRTNDRMYASV
jgi:hypothetical protein